MDHVGRLGFGRRFDPESLLARVKRRVRTFRARVRSLLGTGKARVKKAVLSADFRHPVGDDQRRFLATRYDAVFPDAAHSEVEAARRLKSHRFNLLGHAMEHGERIAWSRDPVSGRDWDRGFSPAIAYKGPKRLGDIKLPWELSKHQYFFTLGKASWITGDSSYAEEIVRQIGDWIDDNPFQRGINWIDALAVGARAISWIMAFPFYADFCDDEFRTRMARALAQHMVFIEENISDGPFPNNHAIGDATALVAGGLFLDSPSSARWFERGLARLEKEMNLQVLEDGTHVERSTGYHRLVLDHYHLVRGLLSANGKSLSAETLESMARMTDFLRDVLAPDGTAPTFGDSDDARALWVRADAPVDFRSQLALGAAVFERQDFKAVAHEPTEELLWLLGTEGLDRFEALPSIVPAHSAAAYADGGYYVMRGGWDEADPVLVFDCGPLGFGPARHGHADALSFTLYAAGYPFVVDPGTYSYNLDYPWRDNFRSTRAHNTVVVDGLDQSEPGDRMSWKSMASASAHCWSTTPWYDLVDGEHDGYLRLTDPVRHRRAVIFVKPDVWIVWDRLQGAQRHEMELLLHVRPDCSIDLPIREMPVALRSPDDVRLWAWFCDRAGAMQRVRVVQGDDDHRTAWHSPGYGMRVPSRVISVGREFAGDCTTLTCLSTSDAIKPILRADDGALHAEIRRSGDSVESLHYRSGPLARGDGVPFDGRLLYRRESAGETTVVHASSFHRLSIPNIVQVHAKEVVESLALAGGACEVVLDERAAATAHIALGPGIRLWINGQPAPGRSQSLA